MAVTKENWGKICKIKGCKHRSRINGLCYHHWKKYKKEVEKNDTNKKDYA